MECEPGFLKEAFQSLASEVSRNEEMAAESGLRVWSITADGTSVNLSTFCQLGCKFETTYKSMVTKFKHPTQEYDVFVILHPCHMLKLARNALASLSSFTDTDSNGEKVKWIFFQSLNTIQEEEGLKLGNKLSSQHLQFEKHKMNVRLAAQTLSSLVAAEMPLHFLIHVYQ